MTNTRYFIIYNIAQMYRAERFIYYDKYTIFYNIYNITKMEVIKNAIRFL